MNDIGKKLVPFVLGVLIGHVGVRWFIHLGYVISIFAAFFVGKHFGA